MAAADGGRRRDARPRSQLPILREYKEKGRVRYIGVTTTFEGQYAELVQTMRDEPIDFIGTDYAIDERHVEETILPLARDKGIAVLVYAPFGRTRLHGPTTWAARWAGSPTRPCGSG